MHWLPSWLQFRYQKLIFYTKLLCLKTRRLQAQNPETITHTTWRIRRFLPASHFLPPPITKGANPSLYRYILKSGRVTFHRIAITGDAVWIFIAFYGRGECGLREEKYEAQSTEFELLSWSTVSSRRESTVQLRQSGKSDLRLGICRLIHEVSKWGNGGNEWKISVVTRMGCEVSRICWLSWLNLAIRSPGYDRLIGFCNILFKFVIFLTLWREEKRIRNLFYPDIRVVLSTNFQLTFLPMYFITTPMNVRFSNSAKRRNNNVKWQGITAFLGSFPSDLQLIFFPIDFITFHMNLSVFLAVRRSLLNHLLNLTFRTCLVFLYFASSTVKKSASNFLQISLKCCVDFPAL